LPARGHSRSNHRRAERGSSARLLCGRGVQHRQHDVGRRSRLSEHAPGCQPGRRAAFTQPRDQAAGTLRGYFTANAHEYYDLKGILAPIGDTQRQCNVSVLPADLASAYNEFMAG